MLILVFTSMLRVLALFKRNYLVLAYDDINMIK